ncbi:hypothetical protein B0H14DRAFT_2625689 [Mycena olivaceomarginata]|nr:hypothetical protein B0H14DRAFT_2625689 [Mycena olivaceomarginata]
MPTDLWEVDDPDHCTYVNASTMGTSAIEPRDWNRFEIYARRVRILEIYDFDSNPSDNTWSSVFKMLLAAIPMQHIFPKLQRLTWMVVCMPWFSHICLFLCPQLTSLSLGVVSTPTHLALLPTMPVKCPTLTSVTVNTALEFSETCCACLLMTRAFEHLSELITLKSLTAEYSPEFFPSRVTPYTSTFSNLHDLTLCNISHNLLVALINMNNLWSFVYLNTCITSTPTAAETSCLYAVIVVKCDPMTLASLTLHAYSSINTPLPVDHVTGAAITFDMLCPLFAFHAISKVSLEPTRAPKILFDASVVPNGILSPEKKSGLAWFDVDDAVLVDSASVAVYLFALFPGLKVLMWSRGHEMAEDVREQVDQLDMLWGEVEELHQ